MVSMDVSKEKTKHAKLTTKRRRHAGSADASRETETRLIVDV